MSDSLVIDELKHHELQQVYRWIDQIPLSRPKRNIARDFADGVLMSEVVTHFFPRLVDLHNYSMGNSLQQKNYNWDTLNMRVFKKMDYQISKEMIKAIIQNQRGAIERVLFDVQKVLAGFQEKGGEESEEVKGKGSKPGAKAGSSSSSKGGMDSAKGKGAPSKPNALGGAKQASPTKSSGVTSLGNVKADNPQVQALLQQKDTIISDLRETVDILTLKVGKLEQLVKLKNQKISTLARKLDQVNIGGGSLE